MKILINQSQTDNEKLQSWYQYIDETNDSLIVSNFLNIGKNTTLELDNKELCDFQNVLQNGLQQLYLGSIANITERITYKKIALRLLSEKLRSFESEDLDKFKNRILVENLIGSFTADSLSIQKETIREFIAEEPDGKFVAVPTDCPVSLQTYETSVASKINKKSKSKPLSISNLEAFYAFGKTPVILMDNCFELSDENGIVKVKVNNALSLVETLLPSEANRFKDLIEYQKFLFDFVKEGKQRLYSLVKMEDGLVADDFKNSSKADLDAIAKVADDLVDFRFVPSSQKDTAPEQSNAVVKSKKKLSP